MREIERSFDVELVCGCAGMVRWFNEGFEQLLCFWGV